MALEGWKKAESPFHAGERAIQEKLGGRDRTERQGRRMIREFLPEQHQVFYRQLSYLLVGTVDEAARPWASILVGAPGFITAPSDRHLLITAAPLYGDPLATTLNTGRDVGLLGIELHTRRRNRLNGVIRRVDETGFEVQVGQAFGNCPQYIQARQFNWQSFNPADPKPVQTLTQFGDDERAAIAKADTFFITTAYLEPEAGAAKGVDVSHRGGKPGFVRVDDAQTLTIPDFSGNFHFNTLGNLAVNPRAGLLLIVFETGDLLNLSGSSTVIWDDAPEVVAYDGAERLLRFHLSHGIRVAGSLPLSWSAPEFSPFLQATGDWQQPDIH
ncbi:MAG: pyridoxamine 5'-phosphate oxidase family protein [Leptolyngbyaceae cyanobacterium]